MKSQAIGVGSVTAASLINPVLTEPTDLTQCLPLEGGIPRITYFSYSEPVAAGILFFPENSIHPDSVNTGKHQPEDCLDENMENTASNLEQTKKD